MVYVLIKDLIDMSVENAKKSDFHEQLSLLNTIICKELGDITNAVNGNADIIRKTLTELSRNTELPLTKAMVDIWENATPVKDLNTTVSEIGTTVSGTTSAINNFVVRKLFCI